jgi:hypothetical protein
MNIPRPDPAPATFGAQIDAAKRRAEALRREAIDDFFSGLFRWVLRTASRATHALLRHRAAPTPHHHHHQPEKA